MRILVTGAGGMLGTDLCRQLREKGHEITATDVLAGKDGILRLDVACFEDVQNIVAQYKPEAVFHLAAETDVDLCEQKPDYAYQANAFGTENIALVCRQLNLMLVYISTAGVFDGEKSEPYIEFDEPRPVNVYGRTKLAGEKAVQQFVERYFIFRAGWMIGGWVIDKKFVRKIIQQILQGNRIIRAVNDKFGCPTFTADFAKNLTEVVLAGRFGLYHLCGQGSCSRYEVACKIVDLMRCNDRVMVEPVSSSIFPLPAIRPRSEIMRNYKLDLIGLNYMPFWDKALEKYIESHLAREQTSAFG
ncbi:MAG: dTDP-4-dehydrorhamnose reductase [Elusimicrobia bacterium]|nr:dTDP-4-dehydrorhamnose reductase [Elusimicrobiota bacterium]